MPARLPKECLTVGPADTASDAGEAALYYQAIAGEPVRRAVTRRSLGTKGASSDAELWVRPEDWEAAIGQVVQAVMALHRGARPPREVGALHVSITTALFEMGDDS